MWVSRVGWGRSGGSRLGPRPGRPWEDPLLLARHVCSPHSLALVGGAWGGCWGHMFPADLVVGVSWPHNPGQGWGGCRSSPSCFPPTPSIGSIWSGLESPLPPNLVPNKCQGVHSLSNQGGLSGGGIAGKSVRLKEKREDQQREVFGSWRKVRQHIFHILPRVVLPRACLARDLPGPQQPDW